MKFTEQYAATLAHQVSEVEVPVQPVTRDAVVAQAIPEAEPAAQLALTPPKALADTRVANDPRERRRLAKLAAEQALEQAKQAHSEPKAIQPVAAVSTAAPVAEVEEAVTQETAPAATTLEPADVASEIAIPETPDVTAKPSPQVKKAAAAEKAATAKAVKSEAVVKATADVQALAEPQADADKAEDDDEADKPVRPRRPRGRPPKKATPANES